MGNPVLRGDLRARSRSRKIWILHGVYLGILGALVILGLPPEVGRLAELRQASLFVAVLWVQVVLVTYFASACLTQEIAVEGEKGPMDLLFAAFAPGTIIAGKSLASLVSVVFWLLLGLPLLVLPTALRQVPAAGLVPAALLVAVIAWGIAEVGLLIAILFEAEFTRTLAHWAVLVVLFAGTAGLPPELRAFNPLVATTRAAGGDPPWGALWVYAVGGTMSALVAQRRLARMAAQ